MASFGEGDAGKDLLWLLFLIAAIGVIWFAAGGPARFLSSGGTSSTTPAGTSTSHSFFSLPDLLPKNDKVTPKQSLTTGDANTKGTVSAAGDRATIRLGQSGQYAGSANGEYVIVQPAYNNSAPITISGWKINNGGSNYYHDIGGRSVKGTDAVVTIPQGTLLLNGKGADKLSPITLKPGETAYVITGGIASANPYQVVSFKVNKCSGYLANLPGYKFVPYMNINCPSAEQEVSVNNLPDVCRDAVRYTYGSTCRTPVVTNDAKLGELVDGKSLPTYCRDIILNNFNYATCLSRHKNDQDFIGSTWYIYLKANPFGLYPATGATITLFDGTGKTVDTYKN